MANVTYEKTKASPNSEDLVFLRQADNSIVSQPVNLAFNIRLSKTAIKPINKIELIFSIIHPNFYEFDNGRSNFTIEYTNRSKGFATGDIEFRIRIKNPGLTLEKKVAFEVIVLDAAEGFPYPPGGDEGFYSWKPTPPSTRTFLNAIPDNLI